MKQNDKILKEKLRLSLMHRFEDEAQDKGYRYVFGIDEAGRGPLCGPVTAACCLLDSYEEILYINDSKKLSEARRNELFSEIRDRAVSYGIGTASAQRIDEINILNATYEAMTDAFEDCLHCLIAKLRSNGEDVEKDTIIKQSIVLVDGNRRVPYIHAEQKTIVKGDANSVSIAAASILAKVSRDSLLYEYDKKYPVYGFAKHKGYGTKQHVDALKAYGPCEFHRMTFLRKLSISPKAVGSMEEDRAADFLEAEGFRLITRNYRTRSGEIDIIAAEGAVICFVEVKFRSSDLNGTASEAVNSEKQKRIIRTAKLYLRDNHLSDRFVRFDVIETSENGCRLLRGAFTE